MSPNQTILSSIIYRTIFVLSTIHPSIHHPTKHPPFPSNCPKECLIHVQTLVQSANAIRTHVAGRKNIARSVTNCDHDTGTTKTPARSFFRSLNGTH